MVATSNQPLVLVSALLLLVGCSQVSSNQISVKRVVGETFVERGQNFPLKCEFDMGGCRFFSMEWAFNDKIFYTYKPKLGNHHQESGGVNVDLESSDRETVVVTQARLRDSGVYTCSITSHGPEFFKSYGSINVTVGVLPSEGPLIDPPVNAEGEEGYQPGDSVYFVCLSLPSHPASELTWKINGKSVSSEHTNAFAPQRTKDGLFTTKLGLNMTLTKEHFVRGEIALECTSEIVGLRSSNDKRNLKDPQYDPTSSGAATQWGKAKSVAFILKVFLQLSVLVIVEVLW